MLLISTLHPGNIPMLVLVFACHLATIILMVSLTPRPTTAHYQPHGLGDNYSSSRLHFQAVGRTFLEFYAPTCHRDEFESSKKAQAHIMSQRRELEANGFWSEWEAGSVIF